MFKWIRNKLLEGIVKDVIEELPKLKVSARKLLEEKKDEVLEKSEKQSKKNFWIWLKNFRITPKGFSFKFTWRF